MKMIGIRDYGEGCGFMERDDDGVVYMKVFICEEVIIIWKVRGLGLVN